MLGLSLRGVGGRVRPGMRNAGPIVTVAVPTVLLVVADRVDR
jgi:hypothetical protein